MIPFSTFAREGFLSDEERFARYLRERMLGINRFTADEIAITKTETRIVAYVRRQISLDTDPGALLRSGLLSLALTVGSILPLTHLERGLSYVFRDRVGATAPVPGIPPIKVPITTYKEVPVVHEADESSQLRRSSQAGETQAHHDLSLEVLDKVRELQAAGARDIRVHVEGTSSDELRVLISSLALGNPLNEQYAQEREDNQLVDLVVTASEQSVDLGDVTSSSKEIVFTSDQLRDLESLAGRYGYDSAQDLYDRYKVAPGDVPPEAAQWIGLSIDAARGQTITIDYVSSTQSVERIRTQTYIEVGEIPDTPGTPGREPGVLHWFPIIIPPFKKEEFYEEEERVVDHDELIPVLDHAWVKLYPEAIDEKGELGNDAWKHTRKYQYLMRNDRIDFVYRFDYKDAEGEDKSIRVAFVDHTPTPQALESVAKILQMASQAQGGRIADHLSLVTIFPTDNTGTNRPDTSIGMGIDEQYEPNLLGVAIPALGLVELHMDPTDSRTGISSFSGMEWTIAHEVAGHFTDLNPRPVRLVPSPEKRNGFVAITPWATHASKLHAELILEKKFGLGPTWEVHTEEGPIDGQGWTVSGTERVVDLRVPTIPNDPRVVQVHKNGHPTKYSASAPLGIELWPEIVAAMSAGHIPFEEADVPGIPAVVESQLDGYKVDRRASRLVNRVFGGVEGAEEIQFFDTAEKRDGWSHHVGAPETDDFMRETIEDAKTRRMPREKDFLNVLTGVQSRDVSREEPINPGPPATTPELLR